MRIRHIEVFYAIYTTGSITAAAQSLHLSQPSVSKMLARAEAQLGFTLFERRGGRLVPTSEADRLYGYAATIFNDVNMLHEVAHNLRRADSGRIRVTVASALASDLLPTAVASFLTEHPESAFAIDTLHYDDIHTALTQSRTDVGVAFSPLESPGIAIEKLVDVQFLLLTPSRGALRAAAPHSLEDVAGLPFIGLDSRTWLGRHLDSYLESREIEFKVVASCETHQIAKALVERGAGITIVDEITAYSNGCAGIHTWPLNPPVKFEVSAMYLASVPLPLLAQKFIVHLREHLTNFGSSAKSVGAFRLG